MIVPGTDKHGQAAGHMQSAMSAAWIVGPLVGTAADSLSIEVRRFLPPRRSWPERWATMC